MSVDLGDDTSRGVPQSWNKYVYVRNSPLMFLDPNGEATLSTTYQTYPVTGNTAGAGRSSQPRKTQMRPTRAWKPYDALPNNRVNLPVRPVTSLANDASAAPVRPAGYAERWASRRLNDASCGDRSRADPQHRHRQDVG